MSSIDFLQGGCVCGCGCAAVDLHLTCAGLRMLRIDPSISVGTATTVLTSSVLATSN